MEFLNDLFTFFGRALFSFAIGGFIVAFVATSAEHLGKKSKSSVFTAAMVSLVFAFFAYRAQINNPTFFNIGTMSFYEWWGTMIGFILSTQIISGLFKKNSDTAQDSNTETRE